MKKFSIYVLISFFAFASCKEEKVLTPLTLGDFEISTDKIIQNEPFIITYHGDDTEMESSYHQLKDYRGYLYDINFKNKKATVTIPDSISAVAFKFKVNGEFENNKGKGYLLNVHDANGDMVVGGNTMIANYPLTHGGSYGVVVGSSSQLIKAMENDLMGSPEFKEEFELSYLYILQSYDKDKMKVVVEKKTEELEAKENLNENGYSLLYSSYQLAGKLELADYIEKIAISKFPNGELKTDRLINEFYSTQDLAKKEQLFKQLQPKDGLDYRINSLASTYYEAGNIEAFYTYANRLSTPFEKALFFNTIASDALNKEKAVDGLISKIAKESVELTKTGMLSSGYEKQPSLTKKENEEKFNRKYTDFLDTYIKIALKQGNLKEVIKHQEIVVGNGDNLYLNGPYVDYLMADKQYKIVLEKASQFIIEGTGTDDMLMTYKKAYRKVHPNGNLEEAVTTIENKYAEKELVHLKKTMLNEEAPGFALKNLDGKEVTMASLKGKTVILDFWATWCGPCIGAFPGMQKLADKYKDDKNIVFVFVNTLERFKSHKERVKTVTDFMVKKKYNFNILFDTMNKKTKGFDLTSSYDINSIPTKIIIGPDGKVKFKSLGGGVGQDNKLIMKMDLMIRLANL